MDVETTLQYDELESKIFMPNELFDDLKVLHSKGSSHVAFAYSYYYLISWLFRYCKYESIKVDIRMIKQILGYSPTYQKVDYIIKKKGILDELEYTKSSSNYPIGWSFEDELEFSYVNEIDPEMKKYIIAERGKNYQIKYPLKGLYRNSESKEEDYLDGTFFEVDNTHLVPFEVFLFCMSRKDLGVIGFYLWCYIKMNTQIFKEYDVSLNELALETGISKSTMVNYLNTMRKHRMINCYYNQEFFCVALKGDERKANTYSTNSHELFSNYLIEFQKMKVMSKNDYMELLAKREYQVDELFA